MSPTVAFQPPQTIEKRVFSLGFYTFYTFRLNPTFYAPRHPQSIQNDPQRPPKGSPMDPQGLPKSTQGPPNDPQSAHKASKIPPKEPQTLQDPKKGLPRHHLGTFLTSKLQFSGLFFGGWRQGRLRLKITPPHPIPTLKKSCINIHYIHM